MINQRKSISNAIIAIAFAIIPSFLFADCKFEKIIQADELPIGVMLEWSTCLEETNSMFIIEKSNDGIQFNNIGAVKGAGTSKSLTEYTFLDINAKEERLYYRLRQIDFDGSFSFSQVLTVTKKIANNFAVTYMSSVTAVEKFEVSIDSYKDGKISYQLIDLQGNIMESQQATTKHGINNIVVDLKGYPEKIYRLKLKMGNEEEILTFKKITTEENKKLNFARSKDCKK